MCNLYLVTTNQEAIRALFLVVNRYVGNLAPMPGVFPGLPRHRLSGPVPSDENRDGALGMRFNVKANQ